jgi:GNAT superfamily N-acetyltransferase
MNKIYRLTSIDQSCEQQLCTLLQDAVEGGASVGFLAPVSMEIAMEYWRQVSKNLLGNLILWVAKIDGHIVGAIQLELSSKENGKHRAEIQKLFVLRENRGNSLSSELMSTAEQFAIANGRALLVLDTQVGSKAESIYQHLGWTLVGQIPNYAASPTGDLHATAYYFKQFKV